METTFKGFFRACITVHVSYKNEMSNNEDSDQTASSEGPVWSGRFLLRQASHELSIKLL